MKCPDCGSFMVWEGSLRDGGMKCPVEHSVPNLPIRYTYVERVKQLKNFIPKQNVLTGQWDVAATPVNVHFKLVFDNAIDLEVECEDCNRHFTINPCELLSKLECPSCAGKGYVDAT